MPTRYTLMHKNVPVLKLGIDIASGFIANIGEVYSIEHIPVGTLSINVPAKPDHGLLNKWWCGRAIPDTRPGIRETLQRLHLATSQLLALKASGLSLSDQYWLRPAGAEITWQDVNFFTNDFSQDIGSILFRRKRSDKNVNFLSPDSTTDGRLPKQWTLKDGRRYLLKGGSGATQQEPYNEVFASELMECLHIPHVKYELATLNSYPYSICQDFISQDTELVSAYYIMQTASKPDNISAYQHYLNCCEALGVKNIQQETEKMLVLDYLIANEDRHLNNFGLVRNADTLEYLGAAPIYDNGASLWYNKPVGLICADDEIPAKPFADSHAGQIKLVTDFSWVDFDTLSSLSEVFREIVKGSVFIDEQRCETICSAFNERVNKLRLIAGR